ncbi:mCG4144 [Mus musculus]|nr:mCG4144 [Mus musculus]
MLESLMTRAGRDGSSTGAKSQPQRGAGRTDSSRGPQRKSYPHSIIHTDPGQEEAGCLVLHQDTLTSLNHHCGKKRHG